MGAIMTTRELAKALRVRGETIRKWAGEGRIPELRISQHVVRYDLDEVLRSLRQGGVDHATPEQ